MLMTEIASVKHQVKIEYMKQSFMVLSLKVSRLPINSNWTGNLKKCIEK